MGEEDEERVCAFSFIVGVIIVEPDTVLVAIRLFEATELVDTVLVGFSEIEILEEPDDDRVRGSPADCIGLCVFIADVVIERETRDVPVTLRDTSIVLEEDPEPWRVGCPDSILEDVLLTDTDLLCVVEEESERVTYVVNVNEDTDVDDTLICALLL